MPALFFPPRQSKSISPFHPDKQTSLPVARCGGILYHYERVDFTKIAHMTDYHYPSQALPFVR
ncbi:MAG TPA: hypothetical protein DEB17_10950 [Chlorobaculum sp.]|uniref:Uncharacterized protein n=1 Tax=Chlorobaculum tepidum (strain ATCC 49652 / DSM 12025 / NBRC 103806 / TLS) TaxID=194439 RepID=Q8KBG7_CHLTE|nr:hypothetical protein CT1820 [Chlorobaculum tepidum TLS]HBU24486.1 hypothetical protein [Chlorobaculum sp.]